MHILKAACCISGKNWTGKISQVFRHCQGVPSSCLKKQASLWQDLAKSDDVGVGVDHPYLWAFLRLSGKADSAHHTQGRAPRQPWGSSEDGTCACSPAPPIDPLGGSAQAPV